MTTDRERVDVSTVFHLPVARWHRLARCHPPLGLTVLRHIAAVGLTRQPASTPSVRDVG